MPQGSGIEIQAWWKEDRKTKLANINARVAALCPTGGNKDRWGWWWMPGLVQGRNIRMSGLPLLSNVKFLHFFSSLWMAYHELGSLCANRPDYHHYFDASFFLHLSHTWLINFTQKFYLQFCTVLVVWLLQKLSQPAKHPSTKNRI